MTDVIDPVEVMAEIVRAAYTRGYRDAIADERTPGEDEPPVFDTASMSDGLSNYMPDALTAAEAAGMVMVKREVLEPFAKAAALFPWPDTHIIAGTNITARDLRALAAVLTDVTGKP